MKKIISLFKRDYEGTRLVYDEVVGGAEWVIAGEGVATEKVDGTACMVRDGKLYKRYGRKRKKKGFSPAPDNWEACDPEPTDKNVKRWEGWLPVGDGPEDQWHREGWENIGGQDKSIADGTFELVGPKVRGNPHGFEFHFLWRHGLQTPPSDPPRTFNGLMVWFQDNVVEGIIWCHPDGRMVKIKRRDFGYKWPEDKE
jgi:hypothetical protein